MKVGVIGGGQLGRMLALAGTPLGMEFSFLDPAVDACAAPVGNHLCAAYDAKAELQQLAQSMDVVTFEFENVPSEAVAYLAQHVPVFPNAESLRVARDRLNEKSMFRELGIPVTGFANVESQQQLDEAVAAMGLPAILKTRTLGYDGKGQKVLRTAADVAGTHAELGGVPCLLEAFVNFSGEVSVIAVRGRNGEIACYPLAHNTHRDGILELSVASDNHPQQALAEDYARRVLEKLDYVGALGFEFFEVDGGLMANEIAPRVHNSGHWTIEGAECSQFENHLRAIAGLPLGSTARVGHSAMVNCIGRMPGNAQVLPLADVHVHNYGKAEKPGRKVGHVTLRSRDAEQLQQSIAGVRSLLDSL